MGDLVNKQNRIIFVVIAVIYFMWNYWAAFAHGMQESYDTSRYFGGAFDIQNPGISTTFLFTTIEEPLWIMFTLVALSCIAWIGLAWIVIRQLENFPVRWLLAGLLLLISMSAPIWSWHTVLLSESLTQTTVVLWLITIIWMMGQHDHFGVPILFSTLAAGLVIVTRPQLLMVIIPAQLMFLFWRARRSRGDWRFSIAGAIGTLIFGCWGVYRLQFLASDNLYQYRYAIHNFVDKQPSFRAYALETMPTCQPLEDALAGPAPWTDVLAISRNMIPVCPETWIWFNSPESRFSSWIFDIPADSWSNFLAVIFGLTFFAMSAGVAMPALVSDLVLSPQQLWLWTALYVALGIIFGLVTRRDLRVTIFGVMAALGMSVSSLVFLFTVWGADGYDLSRHLYPFVPFVGIALLALIPTVAQPRVPKSPQRTGSDHLVSDNK